MKTNVLKDEEVQTTTGKSNLISWGQEEVKYIFHVTTVQEAWDLTKEYVERQKREYIPFYCTHQGCPVPLGYLYGFGPMPFELNLDSPGGEATITTITTLTAGIFIPNGNLFKFERLRFEPIFEVINEQRRINNFTCVSH